MIHETIQVLGLCAALAPLAACITPAPGSAQVRITRKAADVSGCAAVGNVTTANDPQGPSQIADSSVSLQNQTVGLGGNVVFITNSVVGVPAQGVAYRCPS